MYYKIRIEPFWINWNYCWCYDVQSKRANSTKLLHVNAAIFVLNVGAKPEFGCKCKHRIQTCLLRIKLTKYLQQGKGWTNAEYTNAIPTRSRVNTERRTVTVIGNREAALWCGICLLVRRSPSFYAVLAYFIFVIRDLSWGSEKLLDEKK